jgi:thymidine kinase
VIRIPPQRGGWLEVICGPMFSGKSEEMIRRLRRAEIAGQRVVIFKPRIDDRYDATDVVSHAGARMRAVAVDSVPELVARSAGHDVVGIDEVQFFDSSIVGAALSLAGGGTRVVVSGLDQDFRRLPFGPMPELLAHAEFVDKLQAVCIAAAARRRRRSASWTDVPRRTRARRSWSERSTPTRRAAATATRRVKRTSPRLVRWSRDVVPDSPM